MFTICPSCGERNDGMTTRCRRCRFPFASGGPVVRMPVPIIPALMLEVEDGWLLQETGESLVCE